MNVAFSAARILAAACQAVLLLLVARETAPPEFGQFAGLVAVALFAMVASDLGTTGRLLQVLTRGDLGRSGELAVISLCLTPLAAVATYSVGDLVFQSLSLSVVLTLALWSMLEKLGEYQNAVLLSAGRDLRCAALAAARRVLPLSIYIASSETELSSIFRASGGLILGSLVSIIVLADWSLLKQPRILTPSVVVRELRDSLAIYGTVVVNQLRELETALASLVVSPVAVGLYALSFRLSRPVSLLGSSVAPIALRSVARSGGVAYQQWQRRTLVSVCALLAATLPMPFLLPTLLTALVGDEYGDATPVVTFLIAAAVAGIGADIETACQQGLGMQKIGFQISLAAGLSAVASILILGAFGGVSAAALGILITNLCKYVFFFAAGRKYLRSP